MESQSLVPRNPGEVLFTGTGKSRTSRWLARLILKSEPCINSLTSLLNECLRTTAWVFANGSQRRKPGIISIRGFHTAKLLNAAKTLELVSWNFISESIIPRTSMVLGFGAKIDQNGKSLVSQRKPYQK